MTPHIIPNVRNLQIVIDTNIFIASLLSQKGASHRLLTLANSGFFQINLSVPLVVEYEDAAKRILPQTALTEEDLGDILDYLCRVANKTKIFYLWRPLLRDPQDEMVLELAVAANCQFIVTFNRRDFVGAEQFGIKIVTPGALLRIIGGLP